MTKSLRLLLTGRRDRWFPWRLSLHVVFMLMVAAGVAWAMWLWIGSPDLTAPYADERARLEAAKLVLGVTAGLGGVVALVVAYRRQSGNEAAEDRENTRAFSERFTAAAEQLSSEQTANRLAGVYAMAHLADDWNTGRQTCISVLCAYMRMPYQIAGDLAEDATEEDVKNHRARVEEGQVRRAIMDTIGERLRATPVVGKTWHGHDFDFSGATIHTGNLHGARFTGGTVDFRGAEFTGGTVDFTLAEFSGSIVDFEGAKFTGGTINFWGAKFTDGTINFRGAKFTDGTINFRVATFTGGTVNFRSATFSKGSDVNFWGAKFTDGTVDFTLAGFTGGTVNFRVAKFTDGTVNFGRVRSWEQPPLFDVFPDGPPDGLRLPPEAST